MSNQSIDFKLKKIAIQSLFTREAIEHLKSDAYIQTDMDFMSDSFVTSFQSHFVSCEIPTSPWQYFKLRFAPQWFLKFFPVKTIELNSDFIKSLYMKLKERHKNVLYKYTALE